MYEYVCISVHVARHTCGSGIKTRSEVLRNRSVKPVIGHIALAAGFSLGAIRLVVDLHRQIVEAGDGYAVEDFPCRTWSLSHGDWNKIRDPFL